MRKQSKRIRPIDAHEEGVKVMSEALAGFAQGVGRVGFGAARAPRTFFICVILLCGLLLGTAERVAAQNSGVTPFVECVEVNQGKGTMTAFFGYVSSTTAPVTLKKGSFNFFVPSPLDRGQPEVFLPGVHQRVVTSTFDYWNGFPELTWVLDSKTATANLHSPRCDGSNMPGQVGFETTNYMVNEDAGTATITVSRTAGRRGAVSVSYSTADGTAQASLDYQSTSGVLEFSDGEVFKTFSVPVIKDELREGSETVILKLDNPTGGATLRPSAEQAILIIKSEKQFSNSDSIVKYRADSSTAKEQPGNVLNYPSNISVSGLTGTITRLTVTLNEFVSKTPQSTDILLVGPAGQKFVLMSDAGIGVSPPFIGTLTFDDAASSVLPSGVAFAPGTYKPTNYGDGDAFLAPAPSGPYQSPAPAGAATLASVFNGTDPNGTWSLYMVTPTSGTSIVYGWTLTIETGNCTSIALGQGELPQATTGSAYSTILSAAGGTAPYSFSLKDGRLPQGLSLSGNGTLSGAPTEAGIFPLHILARDFNGCTNAGDYTLVVGQGGIKLAPETLPDGAVGRAYSVTFTALNATVPLEFKLIGALPTGLSLSGATISGTPTQGGSFPINIVLKDANGSIVSRDYTLFINRPPTLSTISDKLATWNKPLTFTATAKDPDAPPQTLTFSLSNAPTGADIDPVTGVFTWTPTGPQLGLFTFLIRVTDSGSPSLSAIQFVKVTVDAGASVLSINDITPGANPSTVNISASLTNEGNGTPLRNRAINFKLGEAEADAVTNSDGIAAATLKLTGRPSPYTLITTFAGDTFAQPSTNVATFDITRAGNCTYLIFPDSQSFSEQGGKGSLQLNTSKGGCTWMAVSNVSWISINSVSSGAGSYKLNFTVDANPNLIKRSGTLNINGLTFTVLQDGSHLYVYSELRDVLNQMIALRGVTTDKKDQRKLEGAIQNLTAAFEPTLWLDEMHLQPEGIEKTYGAIKQTVNLLTQLLRDRKSTVPDETLLTFIRRIVTATRALLTCATNDARLAGADPKPLTSVEQETSKSVLDVKAGRYTCAIGHLGNALKQATTAMIRN